MGLDGLRLLLLLLCGVVVGVPNRMLSGVQGWDPKTGAERFATIDQCTLSAAAAPVVAATFGVGCQSKTDTAASSAGSAARPWYGSLIASPRPTISV